MGLFDGPSGGAAINYEGRLLVAAEEDRFFRQHRVSGLPRASVQSVLYESGVPSSQITAVLVATRDATYAEGVGSTARPPFLYRVGTSGPSPAPISRIIRDSFASSRRRRIDESLRSEFGFSCPILFLDHHLVHAAGSMFAAGLRDGLAITSDGGADSTWNSVTSFSNGKPEKVRRESGPYSFLGFLHEVCERLEIAPGIDRLLRLEDLSRRGEPAFLDLMRPIFRIQKDGRIEVSEGLLRSGGPLGRIPANAKREDLALSALRAVEESVFALVTHWVNETDPRAVALGGDLFEIAPVLRAAIDASEGRKVVLPPAPGDDGLAVGASFAGCLPGFLPEPLPIPPSVLPNPFLGISFGDDALGAALASEGFSYRKSSDIEREVARVVAEGKSLARFEGRSELGNASLGNRSILRSPLGPLKRGMISFSIALSFYHVLVPFDAVEALFESEGITPENLLSAPMPLLSRDRFREQCPDLVGPRGRAKVQTLSAESNPRLYKILREFELWTGMPALAIAPFRLPDEPLVATPIEALRTFHLLGAEYAAFGSYLAKGRNPVTTSRETNSNLFSSRLGA